MSSFLEIEERYSPNVKFHQPTKNSSFAPGGTKSSSFAPGGTKSSSFAPRGGGVMLTYPRRINAGKRYCPPSVASYVACVPMTILHASPLPIKPLCWRVWPGKLEALLPTLRTLTVRIWPGVMSGGTSMEKLSRPVSPRETVFCPSRNWRGTTPIPTKLER